MKKSVLYIIVALIVVAALVLAVYAFTGNIITGNTGTPAGCKDADYGLNYNEKGITSFENRAVNYTDECISDSYVKEYYCFTDSKIQSKRYHCPNGCKDGACITTNQTSPLI